MSTTPDALRLLADPLRSRIVELLAREQLCTCHLADALTAKQPLISYHLKVLHEAGLIEREPCGRFTYYRLRPEALEAAAAGLTALADEARRAVKRAC
ncbi:MAG: metalloregulator ArsR/SmtB family transcription factor [Mycobacteriales bacterium]